MSARHVLVLLLALFAGAVRAGENTEIYSGHTAGELTIDGEGRVVAVTLDNRALGDEILAGYEKRIRGWRFEPILEGGVPVAAKAKMRLALLAMREPGSDATTLAIEKVSFTDHESSAPARADGTVTHPPRYPAGPLRAGVGASLSLLVRVGADGRPSDVAIARMYLLGSDVGSPSLQQRHAREIAKAAEEAARLWRLPAMVGQVVEVPVNFQVGHPSDNGRAWVRSRTVPLEIPAWVTIEEADSEVVQLDEGGGTSTSRLRLLTALEG